MANNKQSSLLVSKVGIIGAGISGIAAAKQLRRHNPVVFEASESIGGVWKHCSYKSTRLQTPRYDYEFSDYPWPERDNSSFPSHVEILDYLHAYAKHFDVLKYVKFNSKVVEIRFTGDQGPMVSGEIDDPEGFGLPLTGRTSWEVAVQGNNCETVQRYAFEYLVVCIGKYGDLPRMPSFPSHGGPDSFNGKVLHSLHYCKLDKEASSDLLKGKKVRKAVSKFIESYLEWKLPLKKYGLKPDHPFEEDYASCQMAILPEKFFSEADQGRIMFKRTSSRWWFWSGGVEFEDKTKLEADVVVLATGFEGKKKLKSLLPEPFSSLLEDSSGVMPLYRGTIHPLIPNMAFVGYLESVSNLHSAELRCKWLSRLLDNKFKLPKVNKMLEQTREEMEVMKKTTRFYKRHCISTFSINHSDEICEEMGWRSWRKKSWISEIFSPYNNQDYVEENKED
ncbi:hypothetical protein Scep_025019 [Stephania cephalantha]|uniref:Flavin-containing monooxygenase n=1 Tax=Stephania cephalantha TaxID=152367 RepID=A0AAP0F6L0_9MAGN